ncbi:TetR/AcrR family transcriptional regulator [Virgibacillus byunsanensis]|uniref:TetR/AcrR family transcriptional regulator n=1 Tax=Virgibacillus byunsanensis TaxID=570945 RepID=A0ABW3LH82_9BACI
MDITNKFENLGFDKQQRILNAALKEFAGNDYDQASTNQIVKEAEIGKGMLFYYFKNKKELYHYLITYSLDIIIEKYLNLIDTNETDFIERYKLATKVKMKAFAENPNVFNFIGTFFLAETVQLPDKIMEEYNRLNELGYTIIYDNIDYSLFRDDIDVSKAFQLIRWSIEGYQEELKKRLHGKKLSFIDMNPYWDEFYEYLDVLKTSFYKKEGEV